jgi:hypothetical protein
MGSSPFLGTTFLAWQTGKWLVFTIHQRASIQLSDLFRCVCRSVYKLLVAFLQIPPPQAYAHLCWYA